MIWRLIIAIPSWRCSPQCHGRRRLIIQFGISTLLVATLAQAWNIIGGFTGYVSFGNSVFYGLGTYGTAIAMAQFQSAVLAGPRRGSGSRDALRAATWHPDLASARSLFRHCDARTVGRHGRGLREPSDSGRQYRPDPAAHSRRCRCSTNCARASGRMHRRGRLDVEPFRNGAYRDTRGRRRGRRDGGEYHALQGPGARLSAVFTAIAGGIHAYWITFIDPGERLRPRH